MIKRVNIKSKNMSISFNTDEVDPVICVSNPKIGLVVFDNLEIVEICKFLESYLYSKKCYITIQRINIESKNITISFDFDTDGKTSTVYVSNQKIGLVTFTKQEVMDIWKFLDGYLYFLDDRMWTSVAESSF